MAKINVKARMGNKVHVEFFVGRRYIGQLFLKRDEYNAQKADWAKQDIAIKEIT